MPEGQQGFDDTGSARSGQQMPDHGLDRPEGALPPAPAGLAPQRAQAGELGCIPHRGAGAVAFDEVHIRRRPAGGGVSRAHGPQLAFAVGSQEVAAQIVGQADAADDPADGVAVAQGICKALQDEDARAFAHHQPVRGTVKRRAAAGRGQGPQLAESHLGEQAVRPRHPARQHGVGAPRAQLVAGQLDRVERRGAGRIQGVAAAPQPQRPGQDGRRQAGDLAGEVPVAGPGRDGCGGNAQDAGFQERSEQVGRERGGGVRGQDNGGEHDAGPLAFQFRGADVSQGFPPGMQQHMVKRVEGSGEARVQVQAIRVEPEVRQKAAARGISLVGLMARLQHGLGAGDPAAGGNVPGGVEFRADIGPQSRRVECSGEKTGHADDGNGIVDACHHWGAASDFV